MSGQFLKIRKFCRGSKTLRQGCLRVDFIPAFSFLDSRKRLMFTLTRGSAGAPVYRLLAVDKLQYFLQLFEWILRVESRKAGPDHEEVVLFMTGQAAF